MQDFYLYKIAYSHKKNIDAKFILNHFKFLFIGGSEHIYHEKEVFRALFFQLRE